jgi:hypothetical protein
MLHCGYGSSRSKHHDVAYLRTNMSLMSKGSQLEFSVVSLDMLFLC